MEPGEVLPDLPGAGRQPDDFLALRLEVRLDGGDPPGAVEALTLEDDDRLSRPQSLLLVPSHEHQHRPDRRHLRARSA